jgi:hypothetical protein
MSLSEERVARNDATFRDANERINRVAAESGITSDVPFICECADPSCTEILRLSLVEYEAVREHGDWFISGPGHETESVSMIERRDGYDVVEKEGRAGEVARDLDPRDAA